MACLVAREPPQKCRGYERTCSASVLLTERPIWAPLQEIVGGITFGLQNWVIMKTPSRNNPPQDLTEHNLMEIQIWPIDKLVLYVRNLRKNDAAVDLMCGSIREFGFKIPCLVRSDGEVIDGHLRLKAARKLEITEIPVILCDEWTPAQVKAFRLMVNRSATRADWADDLLPLEFPDRTT